MATHRMSILGPNLKLESGLYSDVVTNRGTWTNQVGNQLCIVVPDPNGGGDHGLYGNFEVPQNYVGTGKIVAKGILDGAKTSVVFAVGVRGLALADNEAADAAYSTEDIANIASGSNYADEDQLEISITLSNLSLTAGDTCYFYWFIDDSVHTYTTDFLLTDLLLEYADA